MIEKILPDAVACAEAFADEPDALLFPAEEAVIGRAVEKRRREFRTTRHCARRALAGIGIPPVAVLPGERREPLWPAGVVGSLTHCTGYRAAAVARSRDLLTVGIDAEPHEPLPPGVLDVIVVEEERRRLADLGAGHGARDGAPHWDRILFCAKETVYKAWYPLAHRWLGFTDASVTIDPGRGTFLARLLVPGPVVGGRRLRELPGRWLAGDGLVITAIALRPPGAEQPDAFIRGDTESGSAVSD